MHLGSELPEEGELQPTSADISIRGKTLQGPDWDVTINEASIIIGSSLEVIYLIIFALYMPIDRTRRFAGTVCAALSFIAAACLFTLLVIPKVDGDADDQDKETEVRKSNPQRAKGNANEPRSLKHSASE